MIEGVVVHVLDRATNTRTAATSITFFNNVNIFICLYVFLFSLSVSRSVGHCTFSLAICLLEMAVYISYFDIFLNIIQLLTNEALDMMYYRPENTNIDRGEAEVNICVLWSISHHIQCLISQ